MEVCDRLGMYVYDEAFDAWGIMKRPGDYNQFFDADWKKDLTLFIHFSAENLVRHSRAGMNAA